MSRKSWVWCKKKEKLVERGEWLQGQDNVGPLPMVITDSMDATWHPANGQYYESKSTFRKVTRQHGCREVGDAPVEAITTATKPMDRPEYARKRKEDIAHVINNIGRK
jgi:hypothetical protein